MVRFLAEIAKSKTIEVHFTPSGGIRDPNNTSTPSDPDDIITRNYKIYETYIGPIQSGTYWTDIFHAQYVNTEVLDLNFFVDGKFLQTYNDFNDFKNSASYSSNQVYGKIKIGNFLYISIPIHPWLYNLNNVETGALEATPFLSAPLDPDYKLPNIFSGKVARVVLQVPSFTVKVSDAINGLVLNSDFTFELVNNDGYFDGDDDWQTFNTPVFIKKSTAEPPTYSSFKTIRTGFISSTRTTFTDITFSVADIISSLDDDACQLVSSQTVKILNPINTDTIGKPIPLIFGKIQYTPPLLFGDGAGNTYLAPAETPSGNIVAFFEDGTHETLNDTYFMSGISTPAFTTASGKKVKYIEVDNGQDIKTATGMVSASPLKQGNIGSVITYLIDKTNYKYNDNYWNFRETNAYIANASNVNYMANGGSIKTNIKNLLKSDMAYLIQQTDGRLTIRRWDSILANGLDITPRHTINWWQLTKPPEKDYSFATDNFFSTASIIFARNNNEKDDFQNLIFDEPGLRDVNRYHKFKTREFETDLVNRAFADDFATRLAARFSKLHSRLKISLAIDTTGFELLDIVSFSDTKLNDREFTKQKNYKIIEINQAQDVLLLEEI